MFSKRIVLINSECDYDCCWNITFDCVIVHIAVVPDTMHCASWDKMQNRISIMQILWKDFSRRFDFHFPLSLFPLFFIRAISLIVSEFMRHFMKQFSHDCAVASFGWLLWHHSIHRKYKNLQLKCTVIHLICYTHIHTIALWFSWIVFSYQYWNNETHAAVGKIIWCFVSVFANIAIFFFK